MTARRRHASQRNANVTMFDHEARPLSKSAGPLGPAHKANRTFRLHRSGLPRRYSISFHA